MKEKSESMLLAPQISTGNEKHEREKKLHDELLQNVQKLESLGIFASRIAHDFNNLLVGILGNTGLMLMDLDPNSPLRMNILEIETAALRAAELTDQILAYSRKSESLIKPVNLTFLTQEMSQFIKSTISKKAVVKYELSENLFDFLGDPSQIKQVIMNLVSNASDAIGKKNGLILIKTGALLVDQYFLQEVRVTGDVSEGQYVYIEVADNGRGMDVETKKKIFNAFFTTKFSGQGLGLAAVLEIVRKHKGAIKVDSHPGKGTTIKVLFPSHKQPVARTEEPGTIKVKNEQKWRGSGTILLADDEEIVRQVATKILEKAGFHVLVARDGQESVDIFRKHHQKIAAVMLDLSMPYMDGKEACCEIRKIRKDTKILLSSGFADHEATHQFASHEFAGFIQKPYQPQALVEKLRITLERSQSEQG